MLRTGATILLVGLAGPVFADSFIWTVDSNASVLTTTISATLGTTISDTETNHVSGFLGGELALPAFTFGSIHLLTADLSYTTNPSFSLTRPFVGGVNIVGSGLGFAVPGANGLGFVSPTPATVGLDGAFSQTGNGAEGRGTLAYTGVGLLGSSIGTGSFSLLDQSPLPLDFNGTITQAGNQLSITLPISLDQTTVQNDIPVRVQITGNVYAHATTTANGWKANVDGSWGTSTSPWIAATGVPGLSSSFDTAVFGNFGNASQRNISVDSSVTPRRLLVDAGTGGQYRFTGSGSLSLASNVNGGASISVVSGRASVEVPVTFQSNAEVDIGAGASLGLTTATGSATLSKLGGGRLEVGAADLGAVQIVAGDVAFGASTPSRIRSVQIEPAASVSVADRLVVENQAGGIAQLTAYLQNDAIISGGQSGLLRLGVGTAASTGESSVSGLVLSNTSIILRLTGAGDTDLDRDVDFDDLLVFTQRYGGSGFWFDGDFDYDGDIDFEDLLALAQNYNLPLSNSQSEQLGADFSADFSRARSLVPEPVMILMAAPALLLRRRRA